MNTTITIISDPSPLNLYARLCAISDALVINDETGPGYELIPEGYETREPVAIQLRQALGDRLGSVWVIGGRNGELLVAYDTRGVGNENRAAVTLKTFDLSPAGGRVFREYVAPADPGPDARPRRMTRNPDGTLPLHTEPTAGTTGQEGRPR